VLSVVRLDRFYLKYFSCSVVCMHWYLDQIKLLAINWYDFYLWVALLCYIIRCRGVYHPSNV